MLSFRRSWVQAIESVKQKLDDENMDTDETANDERNMYVDMFGRRGEKRNKKGKSKVVS